MNRGDKEDKTSKKDELIKYLRKHNPSISELTSHLKMYTLTP